MPANHVDIHVPDLPPRDNFVVNLGEGKRVSHVRDSGFASYSSSCILNSLLPFHDASYQTFSDL